jgi:hypothetical protein
MKGTFIGSCMKKRRYWKLKQAQNVVARMKQQEPLAKVEAYKCRYCPYFHVGTP